MHRGIFDDFVPHPLLRSGHAQTVAGWLFAGTRPRPAWRSHRIELDDGDHLLVHEDCPATWQKEHGAAVLMHGLCGCHQSSYMVRVAAKLNARGVRTFRVDLRGAGEGFLLARRPYHAGGSDDADTVLHAVERFCDGAQLVLIGFSLSGNATLKLLTEYGEAAPACLVSAVAVCPPIDLAACARKIQQRSGMLYQRFFLRNLYQAVRTRRQAIGCGRSLDRRPKTLWEFDDAYTAPASGFSSAAHYYSSSSARDRLALIRRPTLIVAAEDDPLVPAESLEGLRLSSCTTLTRTAHGGHMGFLGRDNGDADRRWMDWRVVEWTVAWLTGVPARPVQESQDVCA